MPVGEPDGEIRARAGIMQGVESPAVQPVPPPGERGIVPAPRRDRVVVLEPRSGEDRLREFCDGGGVLFAGKDALRPGQGRKGDDGPVDVEAGDFFERRPIGDRIGLVGARDPGRILVRQQHRVFADDRQARAVGGEGLCGALVKPAGRAVEARVRREPEPGERHLLVGQDRRHQARAGPVGVLRDAAGERQRRDRRGEEEILRGLEPEADLDRDLGQPVELHRVDRRKSGLIRSHGGAPAKISLLSCARTVAFPWTGGTRAPL